MSNPSTAAIEKPKSSIEHKLLLMLFVVAVIPIGTLAASLATDSFQFYAMIGAITVQVAGLALGYCFVSRIARQASTINDTLVGIASGNFEARAESITSDELGQAADSLNAMCDNTLNLIQSNEERDQIQTSIENLISEMKQIAAGDLTITTDVNPDMTGSIAASVNHMTEQLRSIVEQVKSAAEQVTTSSTRIREASTTMSEESDVHATRISGASEKLLQMTSSFQDVANLTKQSVDVAVEARQSASKGLNAVSNTVEGMQRIRTQVQNTSKRIKRLGESSQEIGEIVQLISDITDRTSILALNASIQASMAGDAGQGFAVVAEEIERLAERSTDATKQISKLIRGIQSETTEVISDMEESTREVVAGSELAAEAGVTLFEIDNVSNQLVDLIQASSASALQQATSATEVASAMTEISNSTKQSAEKSREATRSVGRLADMVNALRESVSQFKVSDQVATSFAAQFPVAEIPVVEFPVVEETKSNNESTLIDLFKAKPTENQMPPSDRKVAKPKPLTPAAPVSRRVAQTVNQPAAKASESRQPSRSPAQAKTPVPAAPRKVAGTMVQPNAPAKGKKSAPPTENKFDEKLLHNLRMAEQHKAEQRAARPSSAQVSKTIMNEGSAPIRNVAPTQQPNNSAARPVARQTDSPQTAPQSRNPVIAKTMIAGDSSKPAQVDSDSKSIDEKLLQQLRETQKLLNAEQQKVKQLGNPSKS